MLSGHPLRGTGSRKTVTTYFELRFEAIEHMTTYFELRFEAIEGMTLDGHAVPAVHLREPQQTEHGMMEL